MFLVFLSMVMQMGIGTAVALMGTVRRLAFVVAMAIMMKPSLVVVVDGRATARVASGCRRQSIVPPPLCSTHNLATPPPYPLHLPPLLALRLRRWSWPRRVRLLPRPRQRLLQRHVTEMLSSSECVSVCGTGSVLV
jgi:hypothetical protein